MLTCSFAFCVLTFNFGLGTWRNWHTRNVEGVVPKGVEVQILSSPLSFACGETESI